MCEHTRTVRLGDVTVKIGSGATPRGGSSVYIDTGIALIRSQNVDDCRFVSDGLAHIDDLAAKALDGVAIAKGDVLLNITGESVARCCLVPDTVLPARVSQHVMIIRPDTRALDSRYLHALLVDPRMKSHLLALAGSGATRPALTKSHIAGLQLDLPPLSEQQAIGEVLGALDDKIEANRRSVETVERLAIDASWSTMATTTVGEVAEVHRDFVAPSVFANQEVEHFSLPAFDGSRLPRVENGAAIKSGKFLLNGPTVLVSKLNPHIPRVWMAVPTGSRSAVTSTEFVGLVPSHDYPVEVLWALCASAQFSSQLAEMVRGTTGSHQRVSVDDVLALKVPDPEALGEELMGVITAAVGLAGVLRKESICLAMLRAVLLPKLLSGDLQVRDQESLVARAV